MRSFMLSVAVLCSCAVVGFAAEPQNALRSDFEDATVGKLPKGWSAAKTGDGEGSVWKVVENSTAPKGPKVLAQTFESPGPLFNLCVADDTAFSDGQLVVSLQAVKGKIDQGGGLVWRYVDADNYYIARFNPLEGNYRLYKVVAGKRTQLATKEGLKSDSNLWHKMTVTVTKDQIECSLDGNKWLEAKDDTFTKPGKVGFWTKADAQTNFDDLQISESK